MLLRQDAHQRDYFVCKLVSMDLQHQESKRRKDSAGLASLRGQLSYATVLSDRCISITFPRTFGDACVAGLE